MKANEYLLLVRRTLVRAVFADASELNWYERRVRRVLDLRVSDIVGELLGDIDLGHADPRDVTTPDEGELARERVPPAPESRRRRRRV